MFCISEVQILQDVQAQILEGKPADTNIQSLLRFFPQNWCAFEKILFLRLTFFTTFNVVNAYAVCFVLDPTKEQMKMFSKLFSKSDGIQ